MIAHLQSFVSSVNAKSSNCSHEQIFSIVRISVSKFCKININNGCGKKLNDCEIAITQNLRKERCSIAKIAKILNRSRKVMYNLLRKEERYGKTKSVGRPKVTSDRQRRAILRIT